MAASLTRDIPLAATAPEVTLEPTYEALPSQVLDAHGHPLQVVYDISDPSAVSFHFTRPTKNRFNWGKCGSGAIYGVSGGLIIGQTGTYVAGKKYDSAALKALGTASKLGRFAGPAGFLISTVGAGVVGCVLGGLGV